MRSVLLLILLVFDTAPAGLEHRDAGGRSRALGGAFTGLADDVWAVIYNAGGCSKLTMNEASFYYAPQPFGLDELSYSAVAVALPTAFGVVGVSASRYGFDLYRELSMGIALARNIAGAGIGMNVTYYAVTIQNYGSAASVGIDVGAHVAVTPHISSGIAIHNINAPSIGDSKEKLPQMFSAGVAFTPSQAVTLALDYQKETGFVASPKLGFEYRPAATVAIRGGMSDEPSQSSCGFGFRYSAVELDYALSRHPDLGWSHQASVTLRW
jgi:hypothetical protein